MLQQRRTGERLGRLLLLLDYVKRLDLGRALADLWGFPFVTIAADRLDVKLAQRLPREDLLHFRAVPLSDDGETIVVAVAAAPDGELNDALERAFPDRRIVFRVTTEWDIDRGVAKVHEHRLLGGSIIGRAVPSATARTCSALIPPATFQLSTFPTMLSMLWATIHENARATGSVVDDASQHDVEERDLPIYTILVPLHRSHQTIDHLLRSLRQLDYPADKLDIILLFEEEDRAGLAIAKALSPGENVRLVVIPDGQANSHSRACDVGVMFARGEFLVCLHGDDRPGEDQLTEAVRAFRRRPETVSSITLGLNATTRHRRGLKRWLAPIVGLRCHYRTRMLRGPNDFVPAAVGEIRPPETEPASL
jgi:hypothetical protein